MMRNGIWREGDRIRDSDGMGYHDRVPDERLEIYAADEGFAEYDRLFAAAVLAIRRFERASATQFSNARQFAAQTPDSPAPTVPEASAEVGL